MKKQNHILLSHGSGGRLSHELIEKIFVHHFANDFLRAQTDSATFETAEGQMAFTTDSYVVDPIFFSGGNIGKLAVCGTVNDLAVSGAEPLYLSCGFIVEEGLPLADLEKIVESMAAEAVAAGVSIITGDTKVVNRGKCDKLFINTAGVGRLSADRRHIGYGNTIAPGDQIIVSGSMGDHGIAILAAREDLSFRSQAISDCASLNGLIATLLDRPADIRFMRDATRGGLATVLCELAERHETGIRISEEKIPVKELVKGACEVFGFDPLYLANEGKVVLVVAAEAASDVLQKLRAHPLGADAAIIGSVTTNHPGKVLMNTAVGGTRLLDMLAGEMLPRIC
ncbi:MAG: hydrogenase expression/formation protein HypE [Bacteroidales bacterium]|nr:hydrogenase expression/formation protein HypE [Bacteroidales bacterium]